jgi:hypothetical protein
VVGIDETLERRRGKKITAKGIYRDPLLSSRERFVKRSALRDGSAWCFWRRSRGLLELGPYRFSQHWPTRSVTPDMRP